MADIVEGLGRLDDPVKAVENVDWSALTLSAQEGFVLSRVDGSTPAKLICEITGLGRDTTIDILRGLRAKGVIVLGNEAPVVRKTRPNAPPVIVPPVADPAPPPAAEGASASGGNSAGDTPSDSVVAGPQPAEGEDDPWLLVEFEQEEAEGIDLKREVRSRVRRIHARLDDMTFFELLGVALDADEKTIRRAYFKASKQYHPDRYYTKKLGPYKEWLQRIFKQVNSAYEFLQDASKREQYRRMILQEREHERISRDLAEQVAQVASDLDGRLDASASPMSASPMSASPMSASPMSASPMSASPMSASPMSASPMSASPMSASPMSASLVSAYPMSASPVSASPVSAWEDAATPNDARQAVVESSPTSTHQAAVPSTGLEQQTLDSPLDARVTEEQTPSAESERGGVSYSIVRPRREPSSASRRREPSSASGRREASSSGGREPRGGRAQAETAPALDDTPTNPDGAPRQTRQRPTFGRRGPTPRKQATAEELLSDDGDPGRAERRAQDRARRSRLTATNPVLQRKQKAKAFYEQGGKQLKDGKSLAAAASLKLAMTYDPSEERYRQLYEQAVDNSRTMTADGFFKRAIFEESVGRFEAAAKLYQRAADIHPKAAYMRRAAEALMGCSELAKAKEYATQAVHFEPTSVEARLTLAQVYLALDLKKNARREVDMVLKLEPGNPDAKSLLKKVKRA